MIKYETETINMVLQYLSTKPYAEVYQLIEALQSGEVLEEINTPEKVDK